MKSKASFKVESSWTNCFVWLIPCMFFYSSVRKLERCSIGDNNIKMIPFDVMHKDTILVWPNETTKAHIESNVVVGCLEHKQQTKTRNLTSDWSLHSLDYVFIPWCNPNLSDVDFYSCIFFYIALSTHGKAQTFGICIHKSAS